MAKYEGKKKNCGGMGVRGTNAKFECIFWMLGLPGLLNDNILSNINWA